jgi:hypothetical protein
MLPSQRSDASPGGRPEQTANLTIDDVAASPPSVGMQASQVGLATTDDLSPHPGPSGLPAVPGYEVGGEIGRGGMGRVYAGHDLTLEREVAIKTLLAGADVGRFITESKITARLPHPGIPPVYALGTLPNGSHYLVMKRIRGRTLADLLKERRSPGDGLSRWVQVFEQIAQAVGFAHAQGIVHRDLKPQNVMIGAFGEVQVMDWGLAKDLNAPEREASASVASPECQQRDAPDHTAAGLVMGTPGYMAPEQARGESVDARADVFALGSILTAILTGKPAFQGTAAGETIAKAAAADLADALARLAACGADPDLVALCRHCLAPRPEDRPTDAGAVAKAVAALRAAAEERAQLAALNQAKSEVRAAEQRRRRRALLVAGGILVVVLVAGIVTSSLLAWRSHQQKVKAQQAEEVALAQSHLALDALGDMVFQVQNELEDAPGSFQVRREILGRAYKLLERINDTPATSDRVLRRHLLVHMQIGDIAWALGERDKAHQEYEIAYDLARRAFEQNPASDKAKFNWGAMNKKLGESLQFYHKNFPDARRQYEVAEKIWFELSEKMRAFPDGDPALDPEERVSFRELELSLADAYDHLGKIEYAEEDARKRAPAKSLEFLNKSLEMRKRLFAADPSRENLHRLAVSHMYLADLAFKSNDLAAVLAHNAELVKHRAALLKMRPTSLKAKRDLGQADLRLGDTAWYAGEKERALAAYEDSLKWTQQVMWSEPENPWNRGQVCQSHYCIGCGLLWKGDKPGALAHFREALKLREDLYREAVAKNTVGIAQRTTLMLTLARCGEHARAAKLADEVRPLADPRVLAEEVGTTYGLCMAAVEAGRPLDRLTSEERALSDRYRALAIAAVKEGAARGYQNIVFLEGDPDMDPLLALPEFRQWLADFKKSLKKK